MEFFGSDDEDYVQVSRDIESRFTFKCSYCHKKFSEKELLNNHLRSCDLSASTSTGMFFLCLLES